MDPARAAGAVGLVPGAGATVDDPRRRGRAREELVEGSDALGDAINTAAVALRAERYRPRIFGFQVNEVAKLQRWQEAVRDRCVVCFCLIANASNLGPKTSRAARSARGPVALVSLLAHQPLRHCVYSLVPVLCCVHPSFSYIACIIHLFHHCGWVNWWHHP
jgi:hypothetical protein